MERNRLFRIFLKIRGLAYEQAQQNSDRVNNRFIILRRYFSAKPDTAQNQNYPIAENMHPGGYRKPRL